MFEGMLARRYIGTQKRHSALTVCSIAMALALITMLFSLFSTVMSSLRSIAYDQGEYHAQVSGPYGFTKEEYDAFAEAISEYATCTPEQGMVSGNLVYFANVIFNKYIDNYAKPFIQNICEDIGFERNNIYCKTNDLLMLCDMVDLNSALNMARVVAVFYVFVLFLIMTLRLIIDTAFEVSSKERERQLGVLQSVGATPKQIVRIITYEGLILSAVGIPLGVGAGLGLGYIAYRAVLSTHVAELYLSPSKAGELIHFTVNPWFLLLGVITGAAWVFFSAYGTGMRVIKMSPVQAISQRSNTVKKTGRFSLFGKLFGWTGKIASRNNLRQPKRFIASVVALTLSIALFSAVTVITNDLRSAVEGEIDSTRRIGDFVISTYIEDDPFIIGKQIAILEESGLFAELNFEYWAGGNFIDTENNSYDYLDKKPYNDIVVYYYSRDAYQERFEANPPVSYDDLAKSGGYILLGELSEDNAFPDNVSKLSIEFHHKTNISEEEYNALSDEEKKFAKVYEGGGSWICKYYTRYSAEFNVFVTRESNNYDHYDLVGTLDQFENGEYDRLEKYNNYPQRIFCYLADGDGYLDAVSLMDNSFDNDNVSYYNRNAELWQRRAILASVNIGAAFLSILIALIAIVNMVNILATGILNRRGELAAMQCVGMTEKQLYKMTVIECLQYALTSGIAAVAVCELMMFLTDEVLMTVIEAFEYLEYYINYIQPLPIIGIASLCAFVIAVAASVFPLRAMRKTSLVEQIRTVE